MRKLAITTFAVALLGTSAALADTINNTTNNTTTVINNKYECTNCNIVLNSQPDSTSNPQTIRFDICNRTQTRVGLVVGYPIASAENDWRFKGWFYLTPGACHTEEVEAGGRTEMAFAYHAYSSESSAVWGQDDAQVVVPDSKFDFVLYENGGSSVDGTQYSFNLRRASMNKKNVFELATD